MKTLFNKKSALILMMFSIGVMLVSSCKKDDVREIEYGNANIRVVNTVQGSNAQDFYQGEAKLSTTAVAYGESSDYLVSKAGISTISFKNAGTTITTASANIGMETNFSYTLFYISDEVGSGQITGYQDDNAPAPSDKAKVRFVNLGAALNNSINVGVTDGSTLVNGLLYGRPSGYGNLDVGTSLAVTVVGSVIVTTIPAATFQVGKIYTVWFDAATTTSVNYHVVEQK